ncbi:MAG: hypothetical protein AAF658_09095, partial [Myxococcota bacterium]
MKSRIVGLGPREDRSDPALGRVRASKDRSARRFNSTSIPGLERAARDSVWPTTQYSAASHAHDIPTTSLVSDSASEVHEVDFLGLSRGPFVKSYTWDGSNRVTSEGRVVEVELRGVPKGSSVLRGDGLFVTGRRPFVPGKGPDDPPDGTRTARHDSFSQFVAAMAVRESMDDADRVMGRGFFQRLIEARHNRSELRVLVNEGDYANAYFKSRSGVLALGSFGGRWSAADDQEAVVHELSHFDYDALVPGVEIGSINEGRADTLSMLRFREPMIAEAWPGADGALRRADNDAKWSTTEPGHDRGRVVSGTFYDLAKLMHEHYTGVPLNGGLIDLAVADDLKRIYYTFPKLQGTTRPNGPIFLQAVREAAEMLDRSGKLDARFDLEGFLKQLGRSGRERELDTARRDDEEARSTPSVGANSAMVPDVDWKSAPDEALQRFGFDTGTHRSEEIQRLRLPSGEELRRYRVWREVEPHPESNDSKMWVPMVDDSLTLIRQSSGGMRAQVGVLEDQAHASIIQPRDRGRAEREFLSAFNADLETLLHGAAPHRVRTQVPVLSRNWPRDAHMGRHFAAEAKRDAMEPTWVIRNGRLELRAESEALRYFAS